MERALLKVLLLWILALHSHSLLAQLQVSNSQPSVLAQLLVGQGVRISNVSVNCASNGYGRFNGAASNLGLDEGLLLTTGTLANAIGPNDDQGFLGVDHFRAGDSQLDVIASAATFDACAFEFDIIPY